MAIDGGLGLTSVNWIGALISLVGLALALLSWLWVDRKYPPLPFEQDAAGHQDHRATAQH